MREHMKRFVYFKFNAKEEIQINPGSKSINVGLSDKGHYGFWERNMSFLREPLFTPRTNYMLA